MTKLKTGTIETLSVLRKIDTGYVLTNGEDEVLLHISESNDDLKEKDDITVFLYQDKKGQLISTMTIPTVQFDAYDWAEVVEVVDKLGVFVNIGIKKEILVSNDDLPLFESVWPQVGDMLYVALDNDQKERLIAKPVTEDDFGGQWDQAPESLDKSPINGRVFHTNKEGSVIITEEGYRGFIHNSERKQEPRLGEWVNGRVIEVKADGTLNVSLLPLKQDSLVQDSQTIVNYLEKNEGMMHFSDKSDPTDIKNTFNISKAAFKRALGRLMKENKVEQQEGKTYLKSPNNN
ncbi:CvfB family protein [Aquibacillus saliphilus]|uniref:CvfB family protein n=1 Tax=Aquibacillus saliphilus TaxID=1909422 RepID=UPI001CEFF5F9|nr:S1-like domain-containing RNA-binding protein [Aquibacillus saliphilus]